MKPEERTMDNDLDFMRLERNREVSGMEILPPGSRKVPDPVGVGASSSGRRFSWPWLAAWVIFALGLGWFGYAGGFSLTPPQALQAASVAPTMTKPALQTTRIADLKVGLRVLTQNPESPGETPPPLEIPDPDQWRLFTLEQTKKDGGILKIELLRPVIGIASAVLTEEELLPPTIGLPLVAEVVGFLQPAVRLPARTIALGADLGWQLSHAPDLNKLLIGKTLDLNLPEMGAMGEAKIVAIAPCPEIAKGQGRVITGRFIHQVANVVDLKITRESEPIGTTDNHPFWSEDRQDYIPVGELKIGETLRAVNGSQTYVQSIRPRGPPEDVYNLEVEGAHTYHVGSTGVLVHNTCGVEKHHPIPKFLGGNKVQDLIPLNTPVHREFHSLLGKNLKEAGFPLNIRGRNGSTAMWEKYFRQFPGSQKRALDIVLYTSRSIDFKHGTNITSLVWENLLNGKLKLFP